jgi:hypothetical protein
MTIKIYNGQLKIDYDNGTVDFEWHNIRLLRVTHLPDPVPDNVSIDLVALPALTSYTTIEVHNG